MLCEFNIYCADAVSFWRRGSVFLGCHAVHITPESVGETLPYHDAQAGLTITADAIIDNRAELCDKLKIEHAQLDKITDSMLIMLAFQKWGQACTNYILGDYAFVIWDEGRREMFCAVDPTGTRVFYYYFSGGLFAFSTMIKPLFILPEIEKKYNETWVADFLAIPTVMHQLDPEITLYEGIYLLPAGYTLTVGPAGTRKQQYWQVERQPELKLHSDAEYEEAFREVLGDAVRCRLRSTRGVGVMMSGGLDSTSVACLAARELEKSGRRLLAFSSVPMSSYRDWVRADMLADETPYIEAVKEHSGSMDVVYCRSEGKHPLSGTGRLLNILEQPYKILENLFWLDDILARAQELDLGVVLMGGAGNATISWGELNAYLLSLYRSGRWLRLFRQSWPDAGSQPSPLRAMYRIFRGLYHASDERQFKIHSLSPINPAFAGRSAVAERFRQLRYNPLRLFDSWETRQTLLSPETFSHLGVIAAKLGMAHRVLERDPTMDRRVIEFCLSVPEDQYVRGGRERYLIRRAMAGILPDKVRLNETVHGVQAADWAQRLEPQWPEIKDEISKIGVLAAEREYLDIDKIQLELKKYDTLGDAAAGDNSLRMLIRSLIFSRFLRQDGVVT
ncbi:asparagine synthase-related protein [Pelotomaculum propionicicum]|uniref:asparagine synthase-related protein n=1 Tax=Pelotomaculum propionicicum TaxID=258475 RepID=UPI003B80A69C